MSACRATGAPLTNLVSMHNILYKRYCFRVLGPDIVVDNLPHAAFNGADAQLDTAIDHLLNKIATQPVPVPEPPAYPNLAFDCGQVTDPSGRGGQRQRR